MPSLEANDSILEYVNQITLYWKKENVLVANMDIDSDSYILFPLELERLEKLEKLGKDVNKSFITF